MENKTDRVRPEDVVNVVSNTEQKPVPATPEIKDAVVTPAKKEEKTVVPKVETPSPKVSITKSVLITEVDTYITERMATQPQTLEGVKLADAPREPGRHRLSLPRELEKHTQDFAFHWILKDKRAIDEAIDKGWVFVNRQLFPNTPNYLFSVSGSIEKGDLILGCMGKKKSEARIRTAQQKSSDMVNVQIQKHKTDDEIYYKPKLSEKEENDDTSGDMQEGRDFGVEEEVKKEE